jgi:hypothetical protein
VGIVMAHLHDLRQLLNAEMPQQAQQTVRHRDDERRTSH